MIQVVITAEILEGDTNTILKSLVRSGVKFTKRTNKDEEAEI